MCGVGEVATYSLGIPSRGGYRKSGRGGVGHK